MTIDSIDEQDERSPAPAIDEHEREAREWLETVYQGDNAQQLSVRSIVSGMAQNSCS